MTHIQILPDYDRPNPPRRQLRWRGLGGAAACLLLLLSGASPASAQGMGLTAGLNFDPDVLERAGDMPLVDMFTRGLVVSYEPASRYPDIPIDARFVALLIEDGRVAGSFVSESFRLEPGQTSVGSDRAMSSHLSKVLRQRTLPPDEVFPADRYLAADGSIEADWFIPALDGSSKDVGQLLAAAFPASTIDKSSPLLLLAVLPVHRRILQRSETQPVLVVIRKIGR